MKSPRNRCAGKSSPRALKRVGITAAIIVGVLAVLAYPAFLASQSFFEGYFHRWADKLVDLDKRGLLSRRFGAAWQDIIADDAMAKQAERVTNRRDTSTAPADTVAVVDGVRLSDYPSLTLVARLNEIHEYTNTISILDRHDRPIAVIRTNHTRGTLKEFPPTLVKALVAAEDERFWTNDLGFEFGSYVRAAGDAVKRSLLSFRPTAPRGTSTITQQVAKLFISELDDEGRRHVSHSVDRKLREMRIAAALRRMYTPDEILEVYLNHCVTSDQGLIGCKDIALNLFGKPPQKLTDAECVYIARMVKWGRNVKPKIAEQCRIDMPRMARALGWSQAQQKSVLAEIDKLTFSQPKRIATEQGQLVDCANEFWRLALTREGLGPDELPQFDIIDPNSLIRRKGNLTLKLSIDLPLQSMLEKLVSARGFGRDTTIICETRVGSLAEDVARAKPPRDSLHAVQIVAQERTFVEPGSHFRTTLHRGDSLIANIRYHRVSGTRYHRSVFYYVNRLVKADGQYFAYAIMESKTGKLLAYYSRDRIGSKLSGLLRYRTPNGSSTAKPIFSALNFDLGTFQPYDMSSDLTEVNEPVAWRRTLEYSGGRPIGVVYAKSAVRGKGYHVQNHLRVFEGCNYIFDLLASSNNIFGVEACYRLDRDLFDSRGEVIPDAFPLVQYFDRIGAYARIKDDLHLRSVTGVRVYKELARIVSPTVDSTTTESGRAGLSDSLYSVALGTLELSLLEQMHLYNVLYNNTLIERPAEHPSLFVDSIVMGSTPVPLSDTVKLYHPFADVNNLRPTYLGMHKRLCSNRWEGLEAYDIAGTHDSTHANDTVFDPNAYVIDAPVANFAKSGTTDDVIRPYNAPPDTKERTNFGLWNAVLRLDLARLAVSAAPETVDVTVACVGECSTRHTGPRDGKTLHGYVTRELLKLAGIPSPGGFFARYEAYVRRTTPGRARNCGSPVPLPVPPATGGPAGDTLQGTSVIE